MTTKRKTKVQREAELKAALYQRVHDVYSGAAGKSWDTNGDGDFATADTLTNVIPALDCIFGAQLDARYMWQAHCLKYFDNPESATDHLFSAGIRA